MDKIDKLLQKISFQDAHKIVDIIEQILINDLKNLDIKKLKGHKEVFRARIAKYRIIYKKTSANNVNILEISRRDESTYKNY